MERAEGGRVSRGEGGRVSRGEGGSARERAVVLDELGPDPGQLEPH